MYEPRRPLEYLGAAAARCGAGSCSTNLTVEAERNRGGGKLVRGSSLVRLLGSCMREQWARGHRSPKRGQLPILQAGGLSDLCSGVEGLGRTLCGGD